MPRGPSVAREAAHGVRERWCTACVRGVRARRGRGTCLEHEECRVVRRLAEGVLPVVARAIAVAVVGGGDEHAAAQEGARAQLRVCGRLAPAGQHDDEGEGGGARRALRLQQREHVRGASVHQAVDEGRVGGEGAARGLEVEEGACSHAWRALQPLGGGGCNP